MESNGIQQIIDAVPTHVLIHGKEELKLYVSKKQFLMDKFISDNYINSRHKRIKIAKRNKGFLGVTNGIKMYLI